MKNYNKIGFLLGALLALSACSTLTKEKLGMTKKAPDEFMVVPRAPLSLPPEYDLRPVTEVQQPEDTSRMNAGEKALLERVDNEK